MLGHGARINPYQLGLSLPLSKGTSSNTSIVLSTNIGVPSLISVFSDVSVEAVPLQSTLEHDHLQNNGKPFNY